MVTLEAAESVGHRCSLAGRLVYLAPLLVPGFQVCYELAEVVLPTPVGTIARGT